MSNIQLDYSDITDIFKEKLKIDNIVKKVSSIFLNQRYAGKINYKPYFQRNYVWDEEKATYFIESILLGTEIPPLVLFQTKDKNEVIDGRQRYETIKRFLEDKLVLKDKGLHSLKALSGKKYSQLDPETRELFEDTRTRLAQNAISDYKKFVEKKEELELCDIKVMLSWSFDTRRYTFGDDATTYLDDKGKPQKPKSGCATLVAMLVLGLSLCCLLYLVIVLD